MATRPSLPLDRRRIGWWLVGIVVAAIVVLFFYSFVGTFIFGMFVYYGARPVHREILEVTGSRNLAATVTLLFIVLPTLAIVAYAGFVAYTELRAMVGRETLTLILQRIPGYQKSLGDVLQQLPELLQRAGQNAEVQSGVETVLGTLALVSNGLLHFTLAFAFAFFLYRDGNRLQAWFSTEVGGRDTAAYSYLSGVDADLEVVYFGNVLTVIAVGIASVLVYNGYNLIAPTAVVLPFPTLLGVLTGLATFVPLVVGKIVYVPSAAYLAWAATNANDSLLVYPIGFLVVAFVVLDVVPQSIVRPYISGQSMHKGAVLFAYILGAALFGWYGLFLGPFLLVIVVQFANVVLGDLIHGLPFSPVPTDATKLGTDPENARVETPEEAAKDSEPKAVAESPDAGGKAVEDSPEDGDESTDGDESPDGDASTDSDASADGD